MNDNEMKKKKTMTNDMKEIPAVCVRCGETTIITAKVSDIIAWKEGELIQNALPYLTKEERELLISNTCGKCFREMFEEHE
tara:strand:+ start:227 stop:469 length:243 start_codon:yes stop_codon:yes gene_type:complete